MVEETPELSPEMKEAIRILREDGILENTAKAREHNEALLARLDKRDQEDAERWSKWEERTRPAPTPENDQEPTPGVPPPPAPVEQPKTAVEKKRRGIWFGSDEDEKEGEVK